jgi:hypothetical protein
MPHDTKDHQQSGSQEQPGKSNPTQDSPEKKGEQGREYEPGQQAPKKEVQGGEKQEEHRKTGTR